MAETVTGTAITGTTPGLSGGHPEVLRLEGVSKRFKGHDVLPGVDFSLKGCQTVSVFGGSGTGKSTLLRLIAGLIKPDQGRIVLFGQDEVPLSEREMLPLRRRMGVVFQGAALFDSLTVGENIAFPLRVHTQTGPAAVRERVAEVLARVGLPGIEERYPAELSGGMKKRVGIARALVLWPEFLLFDEPTAGLDPITAAEIDDLILSMQQEHKLSSIIVTHDMRTAKRVPNRLALLHEGNIRVEGTFEDLQKSQDEMVSQFLRKG